MKTRTWIGLVALGMIVVGAAIAALLPRWATKAWVSVGIMWMVYALATRRLYIRTVADWPIGLLVLMMPVALWATALPEVTWAAVHQLIAGIVVYYTVVNFCAIWTDVKKTLGIRWIIWGLAATGIVLSGLALMSVKWVAKLVFLRPVLAHLPTLLEDTINPNVMGGTLVVIVPILIGWGIVGWRNHTWPTRSIFLVSTAVMLIILALTQSRGAWIGGIAAILVLMSLVRRRNLWFAISSLLFIFMVLALGMWRADWNQISGLLLTSQTIRSADSRLEIWSHALAMIADFPLTGIGMGTFWSVVNVMYPFFLAGPDASIPHAHNVFLQVAVDLGLPGLIAWLSILGLVCVAAWQVYRCGQTAGDDRLTGLGAGLLCSQVALVVHGLTDAVMWSSRPAIVVWVIWGVTMAALRMTETFPPESRPAKP